MAIYDDVIFQKGPGIDKVVLDPGRTGGPHIDAGEIGIRASMTDGGDQFSVAMYVVDERFHPVIAGSLSGNPAALAQTTPLSADFMSAMSAHAR